MPIARSTTPRLAGALSALVLVASACGGGGGSGSTQDASSTTSTTAAEATATVSSDDGVVTLELPDGALAAGTTADDIEITRLDPAELPESVAGVDGLVAAYSLEPDGLAFAVPVTLRWSLDADAAGSDGAPLVALATSASDGTGFELAGDPHVVVDDGQVTAVGTVEHFSTAYAFDAAVRVSVPQTVTVDTGATAEVTVGVTRGESAEAVFDLDLDVEVDPSVSVEVGGNPVVGSPGDVRFVCTRPGTFPYTITVTLEERFGDVWGTVAEVVGILDPVTTTVVLTGTLVCEGEPDDAGETGSAAPSLMALIEANPTMAELTDGSGIAALFVSDERVNLALYRSEPLDLDAGDCVTARSEVTPPTDPALLADVFVQFVLGVDCAGPVLPPDLESVDTSDERVLCARDGTELVVDLGARTSDDGRSVTRGWVGILEDHGVGLVSNAALELSADDEGASEVLLERLQPYLSRCP